MEEDGRAFDHSQNARRRSETRALWSHTAANRLVVLTASVTPVAATGTVQFYDGSKVLGAVPLNGGAATFSTASLSVATHLIKAVYAGDANVNGSQSSQLSHKVTH